MAKSIMDRVSTLKDRALAILNPVFIATVAQAPAQAALDEPAGLRRLDARPDQLRRCALPGSPRRSE